MSSITVGNMIMSKGFFDTIGRLAKDGFESVSINFTDDPTKCQEFIDNSARVIDTCKILDIKISSVSYYGNPLEDTEAANTISKLIELAPVLGTDVVACFAGALTNKSIDEALPVFTNVFKPLADKATASSVKIAFENCPMGGTWRNAQWNIAINPDAWEKLFNCVSNDCLGLQWEPAHQLEQLIEPLPQLQKWAKKVYHLHGKDANVHYDKLNVHGISSCENFCDHRFPGMGDTDWQSVIGILHINGYVGSIDIEGWHDPVYRGDLEYKGQLYALEYLKTCRDKALHGGKNE